MAKGYFFGGIWETNIVEVIEQSRMLCFAYKWLGEKKVHLHKLPDFRGYRKDKKNDGKLVAKLAEVLGQADIVVAHNGDRFDITMTNTRMLFHGLDPLPPLKTVDTCKEARRVLKLPSNKLDDIGEYYGVGRKLPHTGKDLWLGCQERDEKKSWRLMGRYNQQDVVLLEQVYLKMRPYIRHPNVNVATRKQGACPKCGSNDLKKNGHWYTPTSEIQKYQCGNCGTSSRGKPELLAQRVTIK